MRLPWSARTRRLVFVALVLVLLTFPLVWTLATRARVERSGIVVTATLVEAPRSGDSYLVAFRFPDEIDPDQRTWSAEVGRASYDKAVASKKIRVRVLEDRPVAHVVEGEIHSKAPYVVTAVGDAVVLVVGLWWVKVGRRRPTVRIRALTPLEPADEHEVGSLARSAGGEFYEALGTVVSADEVEVVLDVGERRVVVILDGHPNPVAVGSPARARGPVIG